MVNFEAVCGSAPTAAEAVAAFALGTLSSLYTDVAAADAADLFIRTHSPEWEPKPAPETPEAAALQFADVCAALYYTLRSGFEILPRGTVIEVPTYTRNYKSLDDNWDDASAEIGRLRDLGHLITWAEVQRRYPHLLELDVPDHVLALGVIVKIKDDGRGGTLRKVRLIVDASRGEARGADLAHAVRSLNEQMADLDWILPTHLGSLHQAAGGITRRGWVFKADATDAYLQQKNCEDSLRLVGVEFDGTLYCYHSCCFGLANMPSQQQRLGTIFSRIVMRRWAAAGLNVGHRPGHDQRQRWSIPGDGTCNLIVYLDDWFASFVTKADAEVAYGIFIATADELGLQLQMRADKTVPPCQKTDFLGVVICTRTMTLSLSAERVAKMISDLEDIADGDSISVEELQRIVGVLHWTTVVFACCRPYLRQMLDLLKMAGPRPSRRRMLSLTASARADIDMWLRILRVFGLNSKPIRSVPLHYTTLKPELYTDASFTSGGYFWGGRWRMWNWPGDWRTSRIGFWSEDNSIAICELEAAEVLVAVRDIAPYCTGPRGHGRRLVMHIDNLPLVHMILNLATKSPACLVIIKELMWWFVAFGIDAAPVHIPSEENECSDALTRSDEMSMAELHEIVRRWTLSHPDTIGRERGNVCWAARPAIRADLLPHMERYEYTAPGRQHHGLKPARTARVWTRTGGAYDAV